MATRSLPSRDAVSHAISAFMKLARDAPTAKADGEAELFNTQLPLALGKASAAAQAHGWPEESDDSLTGALLLFTGCLKGFLVLGERDRPGPILNHCTAKRAEALTKSGMYLSYVRQLEGSMHDTAGREPAAPDAHGQPADDVPYRPWMDIASSTAALLGSTTFAAECIVTDSVEMSPVTGAPGFAPGMELGNIGPFISGKPPSRVLKSLVDAGGVGEIVFRQLLRLCADLGSSLHEALGVDVGPRIKMAICADRLGSAQGAIEEMRALVTIDALTFHVRAMVLQVGVATSIASLLMVLTEATELALRLDAERAKALRSGTEDVDLSFKCHTALVHYVIAMYVLWLLLPGQLPTPSEPS
ncbi:hypothetical protein FOA52_015368 [Chlamydomonas sp. UWO 241]|nr:hypothetical protein FOA52_015368 [Chlamydomonas sp. UWO 241]